MIDDDDDGVLSWNDVRNGAGVAGSAPGVGAGIRSRYSEITA